MTAPVGALALDYVRNCVNTVGERTAAAADLRALVAERDALEAEVGRLRGALGVIENKDYSSLCAESAAEEMRDTARAALASARGDGGGK